MATIFFSSFIKFTKYIINANSKDNNAKINNGNIYLFRIGANGLIIEATIARKKKTVDNLPNHFDGTVFRGLRPLYRI